MTVLLTSFLGCRTADQPQRVSLAAAAGLLVNEPPLRSPSLALVMIFLIIGDHIQLRVNYGRCEMSTCINKALGLYLHPSSFHPSSPKPRNKQRLRRQCTGKVVNFRPRGGGSKFNCRCSLLSHLPKASLTLDYTHTQLIIHKYFFLLFLMVMY